MIAAMKPLIWLGVLALVGGFLFVRWWFSTDQKARRAMRALAVRRIDDVLTGEKARIVGAVEPLAAITAPLSGRACVYWRVHVEEYRRSGKNGSWHTIVDEHEGVDFLLRDGDQKALVKTSFVHPVLERDGSWSSGLWNEASDELKAFLAERGHSTEGWIFNKNMRYREGVAEPGEEIAVVGVGRRERDPDEHARPDGYRDVAMPERLVMDAPEDGPLLLSDEPSMLR